MNARFWIYHNESWVKITLRPGQVLQLHGGGPDDEGYSYWGDTYEFDGNVVTIEHDANSRDCDGRLDTHEEWHVAAADLPIPGDRDVLVPVDEHYPGYGYKPLHPVPWVRGNAFQRDYEAERAGY